MKFAALLLFALLIGTTAAAAQTRTVTNADLEKFRQARLKAERDLAERYKELGFPSPEEVRLQAEKDRTERDALIARLADERLRRELADALREAASRGPGVGQQIYSAHGLQTDFVYIPGTYPGSYRPLRARQFSPPVSAGNGIPVVNYYGTPSIVRPRPVFVTRRR